MRLRKYLKKAVLIALSTLLLTGCSNTEQVKSSEKSNEDILVSLVLDKGGVQDKSFNESAWSGAKKAAEDLGVEVKYLESTTDADYAQNIEVAMDMESDLIIGIGFNLSSAIEEAALNYPEQEFAIIDGSFENIPSNVTPVTFDEKEAGYLAGLAVAKTVDSDKFGFVGGIKVPAVVNYRDGFEKGIQEVNPNATLLTQYANSFSDASKGRVIAEQMFNEGASAIMSAAGGVNSGVYEVCAEKEKYAVAVDLAQNYIYPNTILTSAIKKVDVGVYETIKNYIDGNLKGGVISTYDINNGGVDYENTNILNQETIDYVDSIKNSLINK